MTKRLYIENNLDFKKNFSTEYAVISLIENIERAIDNKRFVCGIFVDLQNVFDTAENNILLCKLSHNGTRDLDNC